MAVHPNDYKGTFPFLNIALYFNVSYQRVHQIMAMPLGDIRGIIDGDVRIAGMNAEDAEAYRRAIAAASAVSAGSNDSSEPK